MPTQVERYRLSPQLSISRLVTGLWQIADMERHGRRLDLEAAADAMAPYVEAGLTTFDMADHYGSAEDIAGIFATRHPSAPIEVLTKWVPPPGSRTRDEVRAAVQRSLDRLRRDRVDLLQFHAWNYADPGWIDCLEWLAELQAEGRIGGLGLTNFDTAHLRIAVHSGFPVVSNQVCSSLLDQRARTRMSALCRETGVSLLAFGTLAGGFLSERWLDAPEPDWEHLETWSQMKYGRFIRVAGGWTVYRAVLRALQAVARKHGVSLANVASRFVLDEPAVGGIIIGARLGRTEHVADNLRLFDFALDAEDRALVADACAGLTPIPGDCGDEYRRVPFLTASGDLSHHLDAIPAPYPVEERPDGRLVASSGTAWEAFAGYGRAVRTGSHIAVSGTTAAHGARLVGGHDLAAQTLFVIDKIEGALQSLGSRLEDVVRTRVFVKDIATWEIAARVHGERFGHVRPANTLVQAALVGSDYLVEIEADARIPDAASSSLTTTTVPGDTGPAGKPRGGHTA